MPEDIQIYTHTQYILKCENSLRPPRYSTQQSIATLTVHNSSESSFIVEYTLISDDAVAASLS